MKEEANSEAGLFALATALVAGGGLVIAAPTVVGIGGAVSLAALGICAYRSRPSVRPHPSELMNQTITDLSVLEKAHPQLIRIGFIGPSRVGKSTLLKHLQAQVPDGIVTDDPYAVVVLLQTQPVSYFGLVDAAGQAYAQQFRVFDVSNKVIIMLDHSISDIDVRISQPRLRTHEEFIEQLQGNIRVSPQRVTDIHFLLNKEDSWERSAEKQDIETWFEGLVQDWRDHTTIKITSAYHSNRRIESVNSLVRFLSKWSVR